VEFFVYFLLGGMLFLGTAYVLIKLSEFVFGIVSLFLKVFLFGADAVFPEESATPDPPSVSGQQTPGHDYLSPPISLETCQGPPLD